MKKIFCDNCDQEFVYSATTSITDGKHQQQIELLRARLLVTINVTGSKSGMDICPKCAWEAILRTKPDLDMEQANGNT